VIVVRVGAEGIIQSNVGAGVLFTRTLVMKTVTAITGFTRSAINAEKVNRVITRINNGWLAKPDIQLICWLYSSIGGTMRDRDFLIWIHERLSKVHGERDTLDYMHKLRAIIKATPSEQETPNCNTGNCIQDVMRDLEIDGIRGI
jgi:hypothetical protein